LLLVALLSVAGCYGGAYYTGAAADFSYPYPAGYRSSFYDPYWSAPPPYASPYYPSPYSPSPYYPSPYYPSYYYSAYPFYPAPMMGWWGFYGYYPPPGSVGQPPRPRQMN
jgi:hypothetical protein